MADALSKVPDVDIDPEGQFKYILVNIKVKGGTEHKVIVRGTKTAEYHSKCARCTLVQQLECLYASQQVNYPFQTAIYKSVGNIHSVLLY